MKEYVKLNSFRYAGNTYKPYRVSSDNGKTWTSQWLTEDEAKAERSKTILVKETDCFMYD